MISGAGDHFRVTPAVTGHALEPVFWRGAGQAADWSSIADVRQTYRHADAVTLRCGLIVTVFNVRGNNYRLVTKIIYEYKRVYVRLVLTHAAYDRGNWKVQLCRE